MSAIGRLLPVVDRLILSFERPLRGEAATECIISFALLFIAKTIAEFRNSAYVSMHSTTAE